MNLFPKEPKRIRERITRYERSLTSEKRKFGAIDDSAGKRYRLGPLYMLLDDIGGARKSFAWFQRTFPDDMGEPFQYLCWSLCLFRLGKTQIAAQKLAQTWFQNQYLVARLLELDIPRLEIRYSTNWQTPEYMEDAPVELLHLWDEEALMWARQVYESDWFTRARAAYVELNLRLDHEPVGPERSRMVNEMFRMMRLEEIDTGS